MGGGGATPPCDKLSRTSAVPVRTDRDPKGGCEEERQQKRSYQLQIESMINNKGTHKRVYKYITYKALHMRG
jgi:hypothetical protein